MRTWTRIGLLTFISVAPTWAQSSIVPADAVVEVLSRDVSFAEGPAAAPDGKIYFTDIRRGELPGRILRFDPATKMIDEFIANSGKSNGLFFDREGRLVACQGADFGGRQLVRYALDGRMEVLAERFEGKKFRAPNDLCIDAKGRVWFSDPLYLGHEPIEIAVRAVYRRDPDGRLAQVIVEPLVQKPNGVHVSPDGKYLYVADTNNEEVKAADGATKPGNMQLVRFNVHADGSVSEKRVLVDYGPDGGVDGMTMDQTGNVYAAVRHKAGPSIRLYDPQGKELGRIVTPGTPTNCVFGRGGDSNVLYITLDDGFARVKLNAVGYHP